MLGSPGSTPTRRSDESPASRNTGTGKTVFAADADIKTVFVSRDGGANFWPIRAEGLPSQRTFALAIEAKKDPRGFSLIVAASGGGLLEATIEPVAEKKQ
jgi:hypothetical protein